MEVELDGDKEGEDDEDEDLGEGDREEGGDESGKDDGTSELRFCAAKGTIGESSVC